MIDDTVKSVLRAARDAKTIEECEKIRARINEELTGTYASESCYATLRARATAILDQLRFDIANEAP